MLHVHKCCVLWNEIQNVTDKKIITTKPENTDGRHSIIKFIFHTKHNKSDIWRWSIYHAVHTYHTCIQSHISCSHFLYFQCSIITNTDARISLGFNDTVPMRPLDVHSDRGRVWHFALQCGNSTQYYSGIHRWLWYLSFYWKCLIMISIYLLKYSDIAFNVLDIWRHHNKQAIYRGQGQEVRSSLQSEFWISIKHKLIWVFLLHRSSKVDIRETEWSEDDSWRGSKC